MFILRNARLRPDFYVESVDPMLRELHESMLLPVNVKSKMPKEPEAATAST
jgi:hypothetical protein